MGVPQLGAAPAGARCGRYLGRLPLAAGPRWVAGRAACVRVNAFCGCIFSYVPLDHGGCWAGACMGWVPSPAHCCTVVDVEKKVWGLRGFAGLCVGVASLNGAASIACWEKLACPLPHPPPTDSSKGLDTVSLTLRGFTYQAIGQLAQRQPQAFAGRTDIAARWGGTRGEGWLTI